MACRKKRSGDWMCRMAISLIVPLFKIEWLMTITSCFPGHGRIRKLTGLPILTLKPTFTGEIISCYAYDVNVQIN
jgi:hypothetical protein